MVMHDEKKDCHENVREFYVNMTTCFGTVKTNRLDLNTQQECLKRALEDVSK